MVTNISCPIRFVFISVHPFILLSSQFGAKEDFHVATFHRLHVGKSREYSSLFRLVTSDICHVRV